MYDFLDTYLLPHSNISSGTTTVAETERNPSIMFSTLSTTTTTTGTQCSRSLTYDPCPNNSFTTAVVTSSNAIFAFNNNSISSQSNLSTNSMNCITEIPRAAHNKENGDSGR